MARIQFILKHRDNQYSCDPDYSYGNLSSGLFNSARLVREMLRDVLGYHTRIDHAIDNNQIDRLVTEYRPDVVIIEAYWVVPEKFKVLAALHPNITWVIRNHSPIPFAAMEGIIIDWSLRYIDYPNVVLACNDDRADREFHELIAACKPDWDDDEINEHCVYLPNYYPVNYQPRPELPDREFINVGCFGAIRPLKNQLMQAVAAIEYAERIGKQLRFNINGTRVEGRGDAILNNIRALFRNIKGHELIEHAWLSHENFIDLIRTMDVGLQVSYAESFNIVAADMIVNGVPVVVSSEIRWVDEHFFADPNNSSSIVERMDYAMHANKHAHFNHKTINDLHEFNIRSLKLWQQFIDDSVC